MTLETPLKYDWELGPFNIARKQFIVIMKKYQHVILCQYHSQVRDSLEKVDLQVKVVPASIEFLNGETTINDCTPPRKTPLLCHVSDPEDKRRIIGDTFMRVANEVIEDLNLNPDEVMLGQGTLRPDLIESASGLVSGQVGVCGIFECAVQSLIS